MRGLRLHLRTTDLVWTLAPLTALTLMILLMKPRYWVGDWPETGATAQSPAFFLSVICAGAAAWVSGSRTRHDLEEQVSAAAIPRFKAEAYRLSATAITFLVPYVVAHAVAFAMTARTFPAGIELWLGYFAMGCLVIVMAICWGWAIGRYVTAVYAPLIALLTWFVFQAFPGDKAELSVVSGPVWQAPDIRVLGLRFAATAVLFAAIAWSPSRRTEWNRQHLGVLAPAAAGVAVIAVVTATDGVVNRTPPEQPLCVAGKIEMCLWPEHTKYEPMVRTLDARVAQLPPDLQLPPRLYEYGIKQVEITHAGRTFTQLEGVDISEGNKWALALALSDAILGETLDSCDVEEIVESRELAPEAVRRWVEFQLTGSTVPEYRAAGVPENISAAWSVTADVVRTRSAEDQRKWVRDELRRVKTTFCG